LKDHQQEGTTTESLFAGLKVIDCASWIAGPAAATILHLRHPGGAHGHRLLHDEVVAERERRGCRATLLSFDAAATPPVSLRSSDEAVKLDRVLEAMEPAKRLRAGGPAMSNA
jgi:hypothetical protein